MVELECSTICPEFFVLGSEMRPGISHPCNFRHYLKHSSQTGIGVIRELWKQIVLTCTSSSCCSATSSATLAPNTSTFTGSQFLCPWRHRPIRVGLLAGLTQVGSKGEAGMRLKFHTGTQPWIYRAVWEHGGIRTGAKELKMARTAGPNRQARHLTCPAQPC